MHHENQKVSDTVVDGSKCDQKHVTLELRPRWVQLKLSIQNQYFSLRRRCFFTEDFNGSGQGRLL